MRLFLLPVAFCACAVGAVEYSPKNEAELKACLPKLRAGDVVSLLPGKTYYSGMVIRRSGTVTQPIVIKGNGAVLDGLAKIPDDSWVPKGDGLFLSPNKCCHGANHPRVCDKDGNLMRVVNKNVHGVKPETLKSGEANWDKHGAWYRVKKGEKSPVGLGLTGYYGDCGVDIRRRWTAKPECPVCRHRNCESARHTRRPARPREPKSRHRRNAARRCSGTQAPGSARGH